ncbi:MAG: tyrosine-type recombinase/integrase [Kiritimatiellae bacterium]|nr:tyrosine-type recombinase/integrase [Kiritimatiellia bacterium]MDD5523399.1 tyrosine-type recombinase/integrase [Kiritimatiellia bacterium]
MSKKKNRFKVRRRGKAWQVDCGVINGRRIQKSFPTEEEANDWRNQKNIEFANNRFATFELSDKHRIDALEAYQCLSKALNMKISKLPTSSISLVKGITFYLKHTKPEGGQKKVSEVIEEYLQSKINAGRRPRTIKDVTNRMHRFARHFGSAPINLIMTSDIETWLNTNKYKGVTRKNWRTHLISLFNYARKRKYASDNPVEDVEIPILDEKTPEILTVKDCEKLMNSAMEHEPEMVPYFAIALFAGLRPSEAEQLDWKNIDLSRKLIKVIPETAKKRRLRFVEMSDNLVTWLAPYRRDSGGITYLRKRFDLVRRKAGVKWAHDVLRHSYGSYHLAMYENAAKTSLQMGHRDTDVLFNHYRDLVDKEDAKRFWDIKPIREPKAIRMFA